MQPELLCDYVSLQAGRVTIDHKRGHALVAGSGLRLREDHYHIGDGTVRYPELAPVEHPVVGVALRGQLDRRRVGANIWLRPGERSNTVSRE